MTAKTAAKKTRKATLAAAPEVDGTIKLRRLERQVVHITIRGTAPLIVNRFSEKAKEEMLAKMQSSARVKKEPRDPVAQFEAAKHLLPDGRDGFPSVGFKAAVVHAGRLFDSKSVPMTLLKQALRVYGEGPDLLVPLTFDSCQMREDHVRTAGVGSGADLRYRPQYNGWGADLAIETIKGQFDLESLFALVDAAGIGGIGDWRPAATKSATGSYGTFEVVEG